MGARDRLRSYFESNVGKVLDKDRLREVAGISEWARRVRELRDDEGMQIHSHRDDENLKPGQYILVSLDRQPRIAHTIDARTRARILERNGFTCQMCGTGAGDPDPLNPERKVRLSVDHIDPDGPTADTNLRVTCSACNQGRSNLSVGQSTVNLLAAVRKAKREDQLEALKWLLRKYPGAASGGT